MTMMLTEAERLTAIEALIQKLNFARKQPGTNVHKQWLALRATAADLRARQPATIDRATTALEAVLQDLAKSRDGDCRPTEKHCRMVAETINGYWPVVRQALANFSGTDDIREALTNLLPDPLPWREEGEGVIAISVHKKDLRAARAKISPRKDAI